MRECISYCMDTQAVCLETLAHCLQTGGKHAAPSLISVLMNCAEICEASASFVRLGSEFQESICTLCAEVCERCVEECENLPDDPLLQECAEICRHCAESCRDMAGSRS